MGSLNQIYRAVILCVAIHLAYQQAAVDEDGYFYYEKAEYPKDCQDVYTQCDETNRKSGVFVIKPEGYEEGFEVFCDHETDGGGWTVFQRRIDNTIDFGRDWSLYENGFGFLNQEFWMGNDRLAYLTNQRTYKLRINMTIDGAEEYAEYDNFRITDAQSGYKIFSLGTYSGNAGDNMNIQENNQFSTYDQQSGSSCSTAGNKAGGWWFSTVVGQCNQPNLNGVYGTSSHPGIHWENSDTLTFSEMKVKPVSTP